MTLIMEHSVRPGFAGAERRAGRRQRVLKGATLTFNSGYSAFECVVRNQSASGAKLSLAETFGLPETFQLAIAGEDAARTAQVVWRKAGEIGVSFGLGSTRAGGPQQRRAHRVWVAHAAALLGRIVLKPVA